MEENENKIALTAAQMNIWSGQMLNPDTPLYNMIFAFEIKTTIQTDHFKQAFQCLVNHNDVLRMVIKIENDLPVQHFFSSQKSPLEFIDFSEDDSPRKKFGDWVESNKTKLFGLDELLYHSVLFKIDDHTFIWYINQHHLITDGWAIAQLCNQMYAYYQLLSEGKSITVEASTNSFENYATSHPFTKALNANDYWSQKPENSIAPLYGKKPKETNCNSTRIKVKLGKELSKKLNEFALDPDIRMFTKELSLFNVLLTVLNAWVYKVSNQNNFSIGVPSHNRLNPEQKSTMGLFMELLPVSINVNGNESLLELYNKTKQESFDVFKNAAEHKPSNQQLKSFNVVLNYIPLQFDSFPMSSDWIHPGFNDSTHHVRLIVHDLDKEGEFQLLFDFKDPLFDDDSRQWASKHFLKLLDAFINDKTQLFDQVPIITTEEQTLISQWNSTDVAYPENQTLLSLFDKQVQLTPDHTALIFEGATMSYAELDQKANQLANYLIKQGLKAQDIVGIHLNRSFEMMIGIYGVLKAGGVYLPIDVNTPLERKHFMLSDADVKVLLINQDSSTTADLTGLAIIKLDLGYELFDLMPSTKPLINIHPDDLAYVIYTSGSSGQPKGVECKHKGICNRLSWWREKYALDATDTVMQKTPITFDVSLWELFTPLQIGARLMIEKPEGHKDPAQLIASIQQYNITHIHFVPSMLLVFLDHADKTSCNTLNWVFCSGEALSTAAVDKFFSKFDCELHNLYGPTEAAIEVATWACKKEDQSDLIPIGNSVPNTQLYILDNNLAQVPIGVPGELHIAGVQVAKGYLNRDELTNERFIPDIFAANANAKMYKTGDLVRFRNDGAIEYLGRLDQQIKLRGFRIELEEIESRIAKMHGVQQALVVLNETQGKAPYLIAYYSGDLTEDRRFRTSLAMALPDYMIPSFYIHLDSFALNNSGKIDRNKLPAHQINDQNTSNTYRPPETQLEEMVAEVWSDILKVDKIGIDDNFIHLGGDSLSAIRITSRLEALLNLKLPVHMIFNKSSITAYASFIESLMINIMEQDA